MRLVPVSLPDPSHFHQAGALRQPFGPFEIGIELACLAHQRHTLIVHFLTPGEQPAADLAVYGGWRLAAPHEPEALTSSVSLRLEERNLLSPADLNRQCQALAHFVGESLAQELTWCASYLLTQECSLRLHRHCQRLRFNSPQEGLSTLMALADHGFICREAVMDGLGANFDQFSGEMLGRYASHVPDPEDHLLEQFMQSRAEFADLLETWKLALQPAND